MKLYITLMDVKVCAGCEAGTLVPHIHCGKCKALVQRDDRGPLGLFYDCSNADCGAQDWLPQESEAERWYALALAEAA